MPKNRKRRQPARRAGLFALQPHRTIQMYPVYATDDILGMAPVTFIDKETKDQWFKDGAVVPMSRGNAVRLLLNLPPHTQLSQAMGPDVIFGCWNREGGAEACAEMWRGLPVAVREARPEELELAA